MKVGVVDTTFAGIDMAAFALPILDEANMPYNHVTVPGIKDLAVACKKLIEMEQCSMVIALGMPGPEVIDKQCAHEASFGIQTAQLLTNTHILEVFVHYDEGNNSEDLYALAKDRVEKHTLNAINMLRHPEKLHDNRGQGIRQGRKSVGPIQ